MPEFLPGAVFSGILTALFVIVQFQRAGKPRLSAWKLGPIGIAAVFVIPWRSPSPPRHGAPRLYCPRCPS